MLDTTDRPFKLNIIQANIVSLLIVGIITIIMLILAIGYRDTTMGIFALGGMVMLGLAVAIFIQPQWGTYILIISIFTNLSGIVTEYGYPSINKSLTALVFMSLVANRLLLYKGDAPFLKPKPVEWLLLAYGGVWLASSFVAKDQGESISLTIDFAKDLIILLCIVYSLESRPKSWKKTIWLIITTTAVLAGLGTYQVLTGNTDQTFLGFSKFIQAQIVANVDDARLVGPIDDPNFYGQALVAVLPLAVYRLLDEKNPFLKLLSGVSILLIAFAVINTYSRGAFLAMIVILILIAIQRRIKLSIILPLVILVLVIIPFLPARFADRLETLSVFTQENTTVYSESSFRGRTSEMLAGLQMFAEHPLLGVGIGNYAVNYQDYAGQIGLEYRAEEREAHSLYLEIAAELGLFGIATFIAIFATLQIGLARARRRLKALDEKYHHWGGWIMSLQMSYIAYLITSIFLHSDYMRYFWLLAALGITMLHLTDYLEKQARADAPLEA